MVVDAVACVELGGVDEVNVVEGAMSVSVAAGAVVAALLLGFPFVIMVVDWLFICLREERGQ